jgi:hypothetical protein
MFDVVSAFFYKIVYRFHVFDMIFIGGFTNVATEVYEIYFHKLGLMKGREERNRLCG